MVTLDRKRNWSLTMGQQTYRFYTFDPKGRIILGMQVLCDHDEAALAAAKADLRAGNRCEVWRGHFQVGIVSVDGDGRYPEV